MKKSMLFIIVSLFCLCSLNACGGSSGGGGGPASGLTPVFANSFSEVSNYIGTDDQELIYRDGENIILSLYIGDTGLHWSPGDFTLEGDYWKGEMNAPAHPLFNDEESRHVLYLGGKKLGLEYSDFGLWLAYDNSGALLAPSPHPYATFDMMNAAHLPAGEELTFKGNAIAYLADDDGNNAPLKGQAEFQLSASTYSLTVNFEDFYSFKFFLDKDPNEVGFFVGEDTGEFVAGSLNSKPELAWATAKDNTLDYSRATAFFFGADANAASEGVGGYILNYINTNDKLAGLAGTYGAKIVP